MFAISWGKFEPSLSQGPSSFIHPQSLASLPVIGRRNIGGLREKGVDVREPAIPGPNFYRSTRDVIGNPGEHAASFYINPPPSSNDIHCWTALMVRLSAGLLKLSVARLILRITEEGTFSEVFRILCPFCVLARLKNYVDSITFVKILDLFRSINVFNDENIF